MKGQLKRFLIALLAGSMVFTCAACGNKTEETVATNTETVAETESETESETETEPVRVAADQEIVNILLVGQDRRMNDSEKQRSDSMILVTLNRRSNTIDLTSFMRDTYVEIPGWGSNRLNAAYVFGGEELMNETFAYNFGVNIDGNVEVDFYDFVTIIDKLGGVDIDVKEEEISVLNDYVRETSQQLNENPEDNYVTEAGMQHLNGIQTLSYCRIRYVGRGDFERTERQRKVLQELFNNTKEMDSLELLNILNDTFELLNTNMSDSDLLNLMVEAVMMDVDSFGNHNIPEDAGYSSQSVDGMSVLVPDLEACRALIQEIMNK